MIYDSSNTVEKFTDYLSSSDHNVFGTQLAIVSEKNVHFQAIWDELGIKINGTVWSRGST